MLYDPIEQIMALDVGESIYFNGELPFDVHRYKDGYFMFFIDPKPNMLYKQLRNRQEIERFLKSYE